MEKRKIILIIMIIVCIVVLICGYCYLKTLRNSNEVGKNNNQNQEKNELKDNNSNIEKDSDWRKVSLGSIYSESCTIKLDLDGDTVEEEIELKDLGKYIVINDNEYIINKYCKDSDTIYDDYNKNQYYIVDLNNDGLLEIIHRTYEEMISPSTSKYTIYNFENDNLKEIGNISIIGNMPNEIYVKENTIKFEYWPWEAPRDMIVEEICELEI